MKVYETFSSCCTLRGKDRTQRCTAELTETAFFRSADRNCAVFPPPLPQLRSLSPEIMAGSGHRAGAVAAPLNRALVSAAAGEPAPCAGAAAGGARADIPMR